MYQKTVYLLHPCVCTIKHFYVDSHLHFRRVNISKIFFVYNLQSSCQNGTRHHFLFSSHPTSAVNGIVFLHWVCKLLHLLTHEVLLDGRVFHKLSTPTIAHMNCDDICFLHHGLHGLRLFIR